MKSFHGGCHECTMQDKLGMKICLGCQFFEANWSLPDLNDSHLKSIVEKQKLKLQLQKETSKEWFFINYFKHLLLKLKLVFS